MGYWLLILIIFVLLTALISMAGYSFVKKDMGEFHLSLFAIIPVLIFGIYFGIDIPSAIEGGQAIYVDRRPEVLPVMSLHVVYADNGQRFLDFGGYKPNKYEQDASYCITYTKFTKTVLKIEKVE